MASLCLVPSRYLSLSVESFETLLWMSNRIFWPWLCLVEEAFILRSLPWNIMPKSLPLFISANLYHMSIHPQTYEVSSDWAPNPIHSTRPNIPKIAPQNSHLLLLGQKRGFRYTSILLIIHHSWLRRCLFTTQSLLLALWHTRRALIKFLQLHVLHVLRCDADPMAENFAGTRAGIFPLVTLFWYKYYPNQSLISL